MYHVRGRENLNVISIFEKEFCLSLEHLSGRICHYKTGIKLHQVWLDNAEAFSGPGTSHNDHIGIPAPFEPIVQIFS